MNDEPANAHLIARFQILSRLAGVAVIVIGSLVILGWMLDIVALKSVLPGLTTMKFNTALCFALAGSALLLLRSRPRLALAFSLMIATIGFLTLLEYVFGWNLGIDQWLIRDVVTAGQAQAPGRMSVVTGLNFCLTAGSLILTARSNRLGLAQAFSLIAGLIGLLSLAGYLYGEEALYRFGFSSVALHTAIAFIILALGLFFARPGRGLAAVIMADHAGGLLARRMLPLAAIIPLAFGWLSLEGQQAGLYDAEFGLAAFALSSIVVFTMLIFSVARSLNGLDSQRHRAMTALRQARDELEQRVQARALELANTNESLAEERKLLGTLIDALPDYIYIKDTQHRFLLTNIAHARARGCDTPEELVGKTDFDFFPAALAENFRAEEAEIFRAGVPQLNHEQPSMGYGGGFAWALSNKVPLRNLDGEVIGLVGMTRDITERKRYEQELDESRRRAEEASRLKSEFLATMTHELRTPLSAIIGFSDVLLNNLAGELSASQREYTEIILKNGEHLLALIDTLLDVSKIEAGQLELRNARVNLRALLDNVGHTLQSLFDQKGLQWVTVLDPALPPTLMGDEMRLKQILINLVGNAIKFTSSGQVEVCIMTGEDGWWVIAVHDSGSGIPAAALGYIFEEFRQVDSSTTRRHGGTGLGLTIVKRLTELMGGSVSVESEVGRGSTFTVRLPLRID
jgi:PAS domain S-box-containing protein